MKRPDWPLPTSSGYYLVRRWLSQFLHASVSLLPWNTTDLVRVFTVPTWRKQLAIVQSFTASRRRVLSTSLATALCKSGSGGNPPLFFARTLQLTTTCDTIVNRRLIGNTTEWRQLLILIVSHVSRRDLRPWALACEYMRKRQNYCYFVVPARPGWRLLTPKLLSATNVGCNICSLHVGYRTDHLWVRNKVTKQVVLQLRP